MCQTHFKINLKPAPEQLAGVHLASNLDYLPAENTGDTAYRIALPE
jgi:hypothetical protein